MAKPCKTGHYFAVWKEKLWEFECFSCATATGAESGRSAGFAGIIGDLDERNNNNLAWRGRLCHSGVEKSDIV